MAQLKTLHLDKGKGKASERSQQAVDELEYLVTFNRSITEAMTHMIQDLSEGIFINMANLTLARCDSYLDYLKAGVKQDTLTALRNAPLNIQCLFPDQLLIKAEEEVSRNEERCSCEEAWSFSPICFFYWQVFSPTGLEVLCTCLEANQGQTIRQERTWQGLNLPAETG